MSELLENVAVKQREQKLSIRQLARLTGMSFSHLAMVLRGQRQMSKDCAERLERWLATGEATPPRALIGQGSRLDVLEQKVERLEKHIAGYVVPAIKGLML